MMARLVGVVLVGVTGLGAVACAAAPADQEAALSPPSLGQVAPLADARDVTLPLDHYRATLAERGTLVRARQILSVECMRDFGFDQPMPPPHPGDELPPGGIYGISHGPEVDQYGYHQPPERRGYDSQPAVAGRPSAAELGVERGDLESYHGKDVPAGGCLGAADRALGIDITAYDSSPLVQKLVLDARNATEADGRLLEAFSAWSACMKRAGYDYRNPWAANNDPAFNTPEATAEEIATAQADLRCRVDGNVNGLYHALNVAYQQQLIDRHSQELAEDKADLEERIDRAIRVVAGT